MNNRMASVLICAASLACLMGQTGTCGMAPAGSMLPGSQESVGALGPAGQVEPQVVQGLQGPPGPSGPEGPIGPAGPQGSQGIPGTPTPTNALVPIGSIVAWHKNFVGTPGLPDGWLECNGQTVSDAGSPLNGQVLPDLNGNGRFLRGATTSGTLQTDELKGHSHMLSGNNLIVTVVAGGGTQNIPSGGGGGLFSATPGTAQTGGTETRPINMSVVWIIRIK